MENMIPAEMYLSSVKHSIKTHGCEFVDSANRRLFENKCITFDLYMMAAQLIVEAYKKENW